MNKCMKIIFLILMVFSISTFYDTSTFAAWPEVNELSESYHFDNIDEAGIDIIVKGIRGQALYELKCHNADYEEDKDFNYSGAFECRLKSLYSEETVSTLLSENPKQSADWESRGRYLTGHLLGDCADYKDWGKKRTFRLRGMKITLNMSAENIGLDPQKREAILKSFDFAIQVEKDSSAKSSITAQSSVKEPPWFYNPAQCLDQALKIQRK